MSRMFRGLTAKSRPIYTANIQYRLFSYRIHPAIGVARLGDAEAFYDEPTTIGGLPTDPVTGHFVSSFRTSEDTGETDEETSEPIKESKVTRQAALFRIYNDEDGSLIDMNLVEDIKWSVWLANKKAGFYVFDELKGYPLLAEYQSDDPTKVNANGYREQKVAKRNSSVTDHARRQELIIDFGPQNVSHSEASQSPDKLHIKHFNSEGSDYTKYPKASWPSKFLEGIGSLEGTGNGVVDTLGSIQTNDKGELRVLGAHGKACGLGDLSSFAGGDLWWDDISDGPVRAEITFTEEAGLEPITLTAWCMVGSPKYAPELVNISTIDDVIYDAAVRYNDEFATEYMIKDGKYNLGENGFKPLFERDIKPILDRMKNYAWVANVGSMVAFANPPFDIYASQPSADDIEKRRKWFRLLRVAFGLDRKCADWALSETMASRQELFTNQSTWDEQKDLDMHFPMMPINSGDNSVMDNVYGDHTNQIISKFTTVTPTQYYMLYQWSEGHIGTNEEDAASVLCKPKFKLNELDRATIGNCVGYPTSPGIETTWNMRVPWIYDQDNDPYRLMFNPDLFEELYNTGLDALRDECRYVVQRSKAKEESLKLIAINESQAVKIGRDYGLQPGDLTKRMAIPWQADFSNCSIQTINFTDPDIVRDKTKPAYYAYWWPPQAPWNVYLGYEDKEDQEDISWGLYDEQGSGQQVFYQRGIMNQTDVYSAMIDHWSHLGFIKNESNDKDYPYFTENERQVHKFIKNYGEGGTPVAK